MKSRALLWTLPLLVDVSTREVKLTAQVGERQLPLRIPVTCRSVK